MKACRSRSRCRSASDHCRRACSATRKAAFFLFKRMLIHRSMKETTSWTLRSTMMTTLPGMYCGASLLRKISDPQMFPIAKETRVIALMVDCSFVSYCVSAALTPYVPSWCAQRRWTRCRHIWSREHFRTSQSNTQLFAISKVVDKLTFLPLTEQKDTLLARVGHAN
jgi:hypothetical protein